MSQTQKKKRHVLPTLVLAFAGLSVSTAHAHDSTATNNNNVRAVLTTTKWSEGGIHSLEIKGLKDVQACFQVGAAVTSIKDTSISSTISCIQDGEVLAMQSCSGNEACKTQILKAAKQPAQ